MSTTPEGLRAIWSEITEPAQRLLLEKAGGFEASTTAPLQLTLSGPEGYARRIGQFLHDKELPVVRIKKGKAKTPLDIHPIPGLILMSHLYPNIPDDREGVLFTVNRIIRRSPSGLHKVLSAFITSANGDLSSQGLGLIIPNPPKLDQEDQSEEKEVSRSA